MSTAPTDVKRCRLPKLVRDDSSVTCSAVLDLASCDDSRFRAAPCSYAVDAGKAVRGRAYRKLVGLGCSDARRALAAHDDSVNDMGTMSPFNMDMMSMKRAWFFF